MFKASDRFPPKKVKCRRGLRSTPWSSASVTYSGLKNEKKTCFIASCAQYCLFSRDEKDKFETVDRWMSRCGGELRGGELAMGRNRQTPGKLAHVNGIVNFAQIVKKSTCLMTTTQYNSNNSLTPEFKWTQSFEKRNNLVQLFNIPKDLWSKFRLGSTIRNPRQKLQLIHDPLCFRNPRIRAIYRTNPQSVLFLRPNPSIRKPIHPPPKLSSAFMDPFRHGYSDSQFSLLAYPTLN